MNHQLQKIILHTCIFRRVSCSTFLSADTADNCVFKANISCSSGERLPLLLVVIVIPVLGVTVPIPLEGEVVMVPFDGDAVMDVDAVELIVLLLLLITRRFNVGKRESRRERKLLQAPLYYFGVIMGG